MHAAPHAAKKPPWHIRLHVSGVGAQVEELLQLDGTNEEYLELSKSLAEVVELTEDLLREAQQGGSAAASEQPGQPSTDVGRVGHIFAFFGLVTRTQSISGLSRSRLMNCSALNIALVVQVPAADRRRPAAQNRWRCKHRRPRCRHSCRRRWHSRSGRRSSGLRSRGRRRRRGPLARGCRQ